MASVVDSIADATIGRAVDLERVKEGLRRKIQGQLRQLEAELVARLLEDDQKAALGRPGVMTARKRQRLETLLRQTRATITGAFKSIGAASVADLERIVRAEADFAAGAINAAIRIELASVALSTAQLKAVVGENLILGSPLKEWWQEQDRRLQLAFTREMRLGYLAGETVSELVARVRGKVDRTTGLRVGGIMDATQRSAETLARTAVQSLANAARMETYRQNADVVKAVQWLSTLDARTSQVCWALSGLQWDLQGNPIGHSIGWNGGPPAHPRCRSTLISVLRSWDELAGPNAVRSARGGRTSIDRAFEQRLRARGFDDAQIRRIKRNTQASMDGQVARELNYEAWLKSKPEAFQKEVLGETKWQLWRDGKITSFKDLVDQTGRPLTVEELLAKAA